MIPRPRINLILYHGVLALRRRSGPPRAWSRGGVAGRVALRPCSRPSRAMSRDGGRSSSVSGSRLVPTGRRYARPSAERWPDEWNAPQAAPCPLTSRPQRP